MDHEMKPYYALIPVLLSVLFVLAVGLLSNPRSGSNAACARAIRARLPDPSTYSEIAAEYKRGDETWSRDEISSQVEKEVDRLTLTESNSPQLDDGAAREKLARDLKAGFTSMLPSEGNHFNFAISKIDFEAQNQFSAPIPHIAYCKFLVVDGADSREPFSVIIR